MFYGSFEADILGIMDSVLNESTKQLPTMIKFMPDQYKPVWDKMNESEKNRVFAKSQLYTLNTPYQVKTFWDGGGGRSGCSISSGLYTSARASPRRHAIV